MTTSLLFCGSMLLIGLVLAWGARRVSVWLEHRNDIHR